jgi:beta-lactamase superfamily II metal-dependent hydrolase
VGTVPDTPTPAVASSPPTESLGFKIAFIDVGQGDATLVVANNGGTLLIDGGHSQQRIRDRLDRLRVEDLDAIAATHSDADHITGLLEAFERFEIERVYLNGGTSTSQTFADLMSAIEVEGSVASVLSNGDTIPLGDLQIRVIQPSTLTGDSNVDSLVIQISCGTVDVLLTGDAEAPSENAMLDAETLSAVDVLKAGHFWFEHVEYECIPGRDRARGCNNQRRSRKPIRPSAPESH